MQKIKLLSAVAVMALVSLTGCGKRADDVTEEDPTKANLYVTTFEGGVGDQWLKNAAQQFEKLCKDRDDFQEGRIGVKINITKDRDASGRVLTTAKELSKDVYFTEDVDYYTLCNQGKLADITDIVTTANSDDGGKKIIDKVDANLRNFLNIRNEGKYYALPFYDCVYGLVYDKELFEEQRFYITEAGTRSNGSNLSTGPNGVAGDWDDGLPKTYAQFETMLEWMRDDSVTPFVYSEGNSIDYTSRALISYWSDYEGFEQTNLNYLYNGTATNIVKVTEKDGKYEAVINNGVPETEEVEINQNNGYLLKRQAGVYSALNFTKNILCGKKNNYVSASSNYNAQKAFVNYKRSGNNPIAMLFEGMWWENEAVAAFEAATRSYGADPSSFRYGFMPIPKADESKVGEKATFLNLNDSYGFISSKSKQMKLAKEFFAFLHSDEQMRAFTIETKMTRGLDYTFNETDRSKLTEFARDLVDMKQSEYVDIVYPCSGLPFIVNNSSYFYPTYWGWSIDRLNTKSNPLEKFIDGSYPSAEKYFNDHINSMNAGDWSGILRG